MRKPKDKKVITESIEPTAFPTEATSKAALMANVLDSMGKMSMVDMTYLFNAAQELVGKEASSIPDGTAQKNLASINSTNAVISEELKEILEKETLSEETKEKASVLFETAVNTKVALLEAELQEIHEEILEEEIETILETLTEQVDQYLTYVAKTWMKENKPAIDRSIRTELAESFISGWHKLCAEHYVQIPDEQVDAVEALTEEIENLKSQLNTQITENIEVNKKLQSFEREEALKEVSDGLVLTQFEKLKKLSEGIDYDNIETFKRKVKILKESHFDSNGKKKTLLSEMTSSKETTDDEVSNKNVNMKKLTEYIRNTVKN